MPLTETALRQVKPGAKTRKITDERGMYLEVSPAGGKWWRLKYRFNGKEKRISLGVYPDIGLKIARDRRDEARRLIADGIDPSAHRKAAKRTAVTQAANDFETVAREYISKFSPQWVPNHTAKLVSRLERDIFPPLGGRPIATITAPDILQVLRKVEARAIETAHRELQIVGQVMRYGVATGRCTGDPCRDLRGALVPKRVKHLAATTEPDRLGAILAAMHGFRGTPTVYAALNLSPLLFVRPGELRKALWADVDLDKAQWQFTSSKTKQPHIVPLATQAVAILRELHKHTGGGKLVFPGARTSQRPLSENGVLVALRTLEIGKDEMTPHGFRAVARTLLDETLGFPPHIIEHQLAHVVRDPLGRAYNRTQHLPERRRMMQAWADHLDGLREAAMRS